jgi:ABC-type transporter Mla MlaB component
MAAGAPSDSGLEPDAATATSASPELHRDPVALRRAVATALAGGASAEHVYATVVRPALAPFAVPGRGGAVADARQALTLSTAHAALAELAPAHAISQDGRGRRAAVLAPPGALGELDARVLADALESSSWTVELIALIQAPDAVVATIEHIAPELVLVPAADPAQVLAAQEACSLLRRLTQPPLVVGVAFGAAAGGGPPALALDHHLDGTDALAPLLHRRLGATVGDVAWGVRMRRQADGLVVTPVGVLDATTALRLREVVETRRELYPHIVIDLSSLLRAEQSGLAALVAWDADHAWAPGVAALRDPDTVAALDGAGLHGALPLTDGARR